jgi:hypothetical protein
MMKSNQQKSTIQQVSQPLDEVLKALTLNCLAEGNVKDGMTYLKAAQIINPTIFDSLENISVNSDDRDAISNLNKIIGRNIFSSLEDGELDKKTSGQLRIRRTIELEEFMKAVYQGDLQKIKDKISNDPSLAYESGRIKSKRQVIEPISAYQYARLVDDEDMISVFKNFSGDEYVKKWKSQADDLETSRASFNQFDIIEVLNELYDALNAKGAKEPWYQRIGQIQDRFPAWLIYFHMRSEVKSSKKIELSLPLEARQGELFEKWFCPYGEKNSQSVKLGEGCAWIVFMEKSKYSSTISYCPQAVRNWKSKEDINTYGWYLVQILQQIQSRRVERHSDLPLPTH